MLQDLCSSTAVKFTEAANLPKTGLNAEHLQEAQMIGKFLRSVITGVLPSGATFPSNLIIDPQKLVNMWNTVSDVSLPRIGAVVNDVSGWTAPLTPNDRWFEVNGSYAYRTGMSLLPGDMNGMKGRFFQLKQAQSLVKVFNPNLVLAGQGDENAAKIILGTSQKVRRI
jgi:chitinase